MLAAQDLLILTGLFLSDTAGALRPGDIITAMDGTTIEAIWAYLGAEAKTKTKEEIDETRKVRCLLKGRFKTLAAHLGLISAPFCCLARDLTPPYYPTGPNRDPPCH